MGKQKKIKKSIAAKFVGQVKKKVRGSEKLAKRIVALTKTVNLVYHFSRRSLLDQRLIKYLCRENIEVKFGIFKGLKYASMEATGSSFGLKIVGIYEEELKPVFNKILDIPYECVWDVGAAEGYYAIGLAVLKPNIYVKAYDVDPYARKLLDKMRRENNVAGRVDIYTLCSKDTIVNGDFRKKTLLILDCEGYERELLSNETAQYLEEVDILVEVHDNLDEGQNEIGNQILSAFSHTHNIEVINSIGTAEKVTRHRTKSWSKIFSNEDMLYFMSERDCEMAWFWMTSKKYEHDR